MQHTNAYHLSNSITLVPPISSSSSKNHPITMFLPIIFTIFLFSYPSYTISQSLDYPTANLSTSWINSVTANHSVTFTDNSIVRAILLRGTFGPRYACGFYCNGNCESYLFAIFIVQTNSGGGIVMPSSGFPQVVWSANPNNPVQINSTLELTSRGDLVLTEANGTIVWSTGTSGMSVAGLNLTESGNLVLFDTNEIVVWQSFDHPTDTLVPGQTLVSGRNLTASVSSTNWTQGGLSLSMGDLGFEASVDSDPPQVYYTNLYSAKQNREASFARFQNGSIGLYVNSTSTPDLSIDVPVSSSAQYAKLMPNGHLTVFEWVSSTAQWTQVADVLTGFLGDCNYPTVCGEYGICSNGQCSCPVSSVSSSGSGFFRQINGRQPNLGCSEVVPITCNATSNHSFLDLDNVTYFNFNADISGVDVSTCREACMRNCSCRAAIFRYGFNSSGGDCYLPSQIFSVMNNERDLTHYNSSVSIKVQISPSVTPQVPPTARRTNRGAILGAILGSTLGGTFVAIVLGIVVHNYRKKKNEEEPEEDYLDLVPGMPTRFSHEELVNATDNFNKKLGQGGFGSVFQGVLKDGTQIAVKCLDGIGQIKESFLAEVKTIGSIHHINLVRLVGFCADKSHRLLVYEYMCNGSLERWIYSSSEEKTLEWGLRRKIILDIAKGLAYLHEDCRQKIIHLDIKPQNILLDENFNAKLADFGLSKLIDRDQSQVVTNMRGTPGYLAPEWLTAVITEKVDVYSYGVVVLEILCGRRNFEQSHPVEERYLLSLFMKKAEEGQWLDIVDKTIFEIPLDSEQAVEMMQIAAWCLQSDYTKRPSMSTVVKVLEGAIDVRKDLDFNIYNHQYMVHKIQEMSSSDGTPLLPSVLSGPR